MHTGSLALRSDSDYNHDLLTIAAHVKATILSIVHVCNLAAIQCFVKLTFVAKTRSRIPFMQRTTIKYNNVFKLHPTTLVSYVMQLLNQGFIRILWDRMQRLIRYG